MKKRRKLSLFSRTGDAAYCTLQMRAYFFAVPVAKRHEGEKGLKQKKFFSDRQNPASIATMTGDAVREKEEALLLRYPPLFLALSPDASSVFFLFYHFALPLPSASTKRKGQTEGGERKGIPGHQLA